MNFGQVPKRYLGIKSHARSGDSDISVDYLGEGKKLHDNRIASQIGEKGVELAEAALRASYAEEVHGLTTFWSWRASGMNYTLGVLSKENELQINVVRKLYEK